MFMFVFVLAHEIVEKFLGTVFIAENSRPKSTGFDKFTMDTAELDRNLSGMLNTSNCGEQIFCRNAYMDRVILNDTQCGIIAAVMVLEIAITLPLNAFMTKGIHKNKMLASVTWQYILMLGYAGCSLSLFVIPLNIILFTSQRSSRSCQLEYTAIFVGQTNCQFTAYLIFLLALHRYLMTVPYSKLPVSFLTSQYTSRCSIVIVFLLSLLHGGASINFFGAIETSLPNILMKVIDVTLGIIISIIYLKLYIKIRRYTREVRVRFADDKVDGGRVQIQKTDNKPIYLKRLAVTISLILLALASCYIPFIIMDSWTSWYTFYKSEKAPQNVRFVYFLTYASVFFTSIANAIIVIHRNRDLKLFIKSNICMECFNAEVHPILRSNDKI